MTFHAEATSHVAYTADIVRDSGACVGVAINPATPVGALSELAGAIDMALCMTVNPGWGGQAFIAHSLDKLPRVRAIVGDGVAVQVDGGHRAGHGAALPSGGRQRVRRRLGDLRRRRSGRRLPRDRRGRAGQLTAYAAARASIWRVPCRYSAVSASASTAVAPA